MTDTKNMENRATVYSTSGLSQIVQLVHCGQPIKKVVGKESIQVTKEHEKFTFLLKFSQTWDFVIILILLVWRMTEMCQKHYVMCMQSRQ